MTTSACGFRISRAHSKPFFGYGRDVAKTVSVKIELVPVNSANRMEFLAQGQIDLMTATMTDNLKRREVVGIVHRRHPRSSWVGSSMFPVLFM